MFKKLLLVSTLALSTNAFATDTRSYNMMPKNFNLVEINYNNINYTKETKTGLKLEQNQEALYLTDVYYFGIKDKLAAAYIKLPYMKQELDITSPIQKTIKNDGYGDVRLLFALGLYNMPALSLDEFKKYDKNGWHSACSLMVTIPTGEYDSSSLVNSGINKYSYKPECAAYFINNDFQVDIFASTTIYSDNKEYLVSKTVEQKNLYTLETRFSYNLNPNIWVSSDFVYNKGGESVINNVSQYDEMDSLNVGLTANFRYKNQILRFVYQKTSLSNNEYQLKMKDGIGVAYQVFF